jgi:Lar family restriction alleviation protein
MSPFNAGEFTDMDGKVIEGAGEPLTCPFCGSGADQLSVERWSAEDDPDASYHVECLKCGCNGPQAETLLEAAQEWNRRSD